MGKATRQHFDGRWNEKEHIWKMGPENKIFGVHGVHDVHDVDVDDDDEVVVLAVVF